VRESIKVTTFTYQFKLLCELIGTYNLTTQTIPRHMIPPTPLTIYQSRIPSRSILRPDSRNRHKAIPSGGFITVFNSVISSSVEMKL
jgi:hypothetical protein